jgi:hypothetical protein
MFKYRFTGALAIEKKLVGVAGGETLCFTLANRIHHERMRLGSAVM